MNNKNIVVFFIIFLILIIGIVLGVIIFEMYIANNFYSNSIYENKGTNYNSSVFSNKEISKLYNTNLKIIGDKIIVVFPDSVNQSLTEISVSSSGGNVKGYVAGNEKYIYEALYIDLPDGIMNESDFDQTFSEELVTEMSELGLGDFIISYNSDIYLKDVIGQEIDFYTSMRGGLKGTLEVYYLNGDIYYFVVFSNEETSLYDMEVKNFFDSIELN